MKKYETGYERHMRLAKYRRWGDALITICGLAAIAFLFYALIWLLN